MILVDTSVLISFFKGIDNYPVTLFNEILGKKILFGISNEIYQEILQGALTEKEFNNLKDYLVTQKFYNLLNGTKSYEDAARKYYLCRKKGYIIRSTIDFVIVQICIENDLYLLHNDKDFINISRVIKELKIY